MIPAYDETYLPDAMANLAGAFDYALNDCGLPVGLFMDFFATSEAAALFGRGTPKYVCGMSGEELVAEIMRQTGWARILDMPPAALRAGSTPEYWAGWVLAYCQWARGVRFSDILDVLSLDDIVRLHPTLHEADGSRFVDVYDEPPAEIVDIEPENLQAVLQGMRDLVVSGSVAYYFKDCVVDAAAKTGTAQTGGKVSNGVFVAFAPYDDPQIALAVVIEKGGSGGALASTAVQILNAYFTSVDEAKAVVGENMLIQ